MKILHRFMLKQFLSPFIIAFVIVIFTLLMQFLWKYIDDLVGKGLALSVIGELLLYTSAQLSIMAFPLAVLLASIFTLGNLGENYELMALKASGISLQRIVFPLIVLSVAIGVCAFVFANNVTPGATLSMRTLIHDIQQQRPELQVQEGIFYNGIEGYSFRIDRRNYKTKMLYGLMMYNHTKKQGNTQVILADSGEMKVTADKRFLEVTLYHGHSYEDVVDAKRPARKNKNYPFRLDFFDRQVFRMALPGFDLERSDGQLFKSSYQMMNLAQLNYTIDSLSQVLVTQEDQLRKIVQPVYRNPELVHQPVDTSLRTKVPDNFREEFDKQSKSKRQMAIQEAVNSVRTQKDQVAGLTYELDDKSKRTWKYEIEWHRKFTMSLACIIFFFIGAPLGAIIRKGGLGTPIIIAVLFFVLYYVISMIGEKSTREGALTSFEGMWLSTFIVLPIGIFLTFMATRDSSIFNQELYVNYMKKSLSFMFATHRIPRPEVDYTATSTDLAPENMIVKLEELSQHCKLYLEGDFRKHMRFSKIWYKQEDQALAGIADRYDNVRAILQQSNVDMIRETVAEYPRAALHNYKIKKDSSRQVMAAGIIFPVWLYLYLKAWIQKYSLRNELRNIMGANRNLMNELNSIL
ncbi:MAG: LptF/LptG family permease [Bacteroidales bacterium]|jgi:lipopolysaccharide export system permease protein|nr:LptF/LptG family permease [Bacteroidales bacterium]